MCILIHKATTRTITHSDKLKNITNNRNGTLKNVAITHREGENKEQRNKTQHK